MIYLRVLVPLWLKKGKGLNVAENAPQSLMNSLSTIARRSAQVGAVVWLLLLLTTTTDSRETELIHKVVFFAILVVVPLALSLIPVDAQQGGPFLYRLAVYIQPIAAALTIASFFLEMGVTSAALSSAWFILTAVIALFGLTRIMTRGAPPVHELSIDAGMLYLPVAGAWLVIYRFGQPALIMAKRSFCSRLFTFTSRPTRRL